MLARLTKTRQRFLSSTTDSLSVPAVRLSTVGRRAFPVTSACIWNDLPSDISFLPSLLTYKRRLKMQIFRRSYSGLTFWLFLPSVVLEVCYLGHAKNKLDWLKDCCCGNWWNASCRQLLTKPRWCRVTKIRNTIDYRCVVNCLCKQCQVYSFLRSALVFSIYIRCIEFCVAVGPKNDARIIVDF